jgi:hypothetical protein
MASRVSVQRPDRCGQGKDALQDSHEDSGGVWPPYRSRSSWALKVWLMDSIVWRNGLNKCAAARSFSPLRTGRSSRRS